MIGLHDFLGLASKGFAVGAVMGLGVALIRYVRRGFSLVLTGSYRGLA